jgi:hypothetical protein
MLRAFRLLRERSPEVYPLVAGLLQQATPTFTWPQALTRKTGDREYGLAVAAWLLLVRDLLLFEDAARLVLLAGVPAAWLERDGALEAIDAPTAWGRVTLRAAWQTADNRLRLTIATDTPPPDGYDLCLPRPAVAAERDGAPWPLPAPATRLMVPPETRSLVVHFG